MTVVIPVYNRGALVELTLRSLASQSARGFDVVLVDNGSTDSTPQVLGRWRDDMARERPDLRVTVTDCHVRGAANARNAGLAEVVTPWVMFFDSDDEMLPDHIARVVDSVISVGRADIIGFDALRRSSGKSDAPMRFNRRGSLMFNQLMHCVLSTQRMAVSTEFLRKAGGWNGALLGWDDYELGVRLLLAGPSVVGLEGAPRVIIHAHPESITGVGYSHGARKWEQALDSVEAMLAENGCHRYMPYVNAVRATLAGHYRREGAVADYRRIIHRLRHEHLSLWQRIVMWGIVAAVRLFGHGGALISRICLGS